MAVERKEPKLRFSGYVGSWKVLKLGDITSPCKDKAKDKEYPVYSVTNDRGFVPQNEQFEEREIASKNRSNYSIVRKNQFAYNPSRINVGSIDYLKEDKEVIISPLYVVFECINGTDKDFINAFIKTNSFSNQREINTAGSVRDSLSYDGFSNILLGIPSLDEQEKIGSFFVCVNNLINLYQKKQDEIKFLKKAMLQKVFPKEGETIPEIRFAGFTDPWEPHKLSDMSDFITKGATPTTYGFEWVDEGIPFFRNDAIKENRFVYGDYSYISEDANEALSRSEITADDILVAITGDIGKVGIVPKTIKKANINQHTARVRIVRDAIPYFVYQSLAREEQQKVYQKIKTGLSMPQLSLEQIRETLILCPSYEEQTKIADALYKIDNLITLHQRKCDELKELKKGLLQQMFV